MTIGEGQDAKGRFTAGHKFAKGRPRGSRNKPMKPPPPAIARRFHDILSGITGDLGGRSELTTGEMQLAKRAAYISMHCEVMEQHPAPSTADLAVYGTLTSHLGKTLRLLGLKRVPKDVTPTLRDYLDAARRPDSDADSVDLSGQSPVETPDTLER
jgi:hypothetical protein